MVRGYIFLFRKSINLKTNTTQLFEAFGSRNKLFRWQKKTDPGTDPFGRGGLIMTGVEEKAEEKAWTLKLLCMLNK